MRKILLLLIIVCSSMAARAAISEKDLKDAHWRVDKYMDRVMQDSTWLVSRLQMYWHSHATDVFIMGETFDHAGGERAPYPTIKYNGTRSTASSYNRPKLEDIVPYDDDKQSNVTYISRSTGQLEKAHPSKTGCNIAGVNREIASIAKNAAIIYSDGGDERYARLAAPVVDAFLKGIYYRNVPTDLNHGHQQTLVGMTTFEVIHEDALFDLAEAVRLLRDYLTANNYPNDIYDGALKKWADNIIANGVPHNNWDLFQAEFIADVAITLDDDSKYADGKGRQYYMDYVMNGNSIRQWGMRKLADFGFDKDNGIWYESPGYSTTVLRDFAHFANKLDDRAGVDLFSELPQLKKGLMSSAEYLFPNRLICGFGDTHPSYINRKGLEEFLSYAKRHNDEAAQKEYEALYNALDSNAPDADVEKYVSGTFYAPNVSWLVQRTGMNKQHDLMYSLNGSLGNHQHANGISLELYGKGYVLGPDAGIGKHLYSGLDYSEYYSQMPAHNTVVVDGVSSYPAMMSQHAFKVDSRYPATDDKGEFKDATYSQVSFVEPESQSDQLRTVGIVKTSDKGGYYVDIFRSKKKEGGDKTHDYFYHNLGQEMTLTAADGGELGLQSTDELAFAGGHLYAYSYIYDKSSATTTKDVKSVFTTTCEDDGRKIFMTMWMKGDENRSVFNALSPVNLEYERMPVQPYVIEKQPVLTFVARQQGEAWNHPFVAVFEPSDSDEPSEIEKVEFFAPKCSDSSAVGIKVSHKDGVVDHIFSSPSETQMSFGKMKVNAVYAVFRDGKRIL